jgi:AcrR family transcriptional regulator
VEVTAVTDDVDGRRLRRQQNRDAVVDALVALFGEGIYQPSSNDIAERAGLSPRSLFRYFDDIDDLSRAAIAQQLDAARPLLDPGVGAEAPTALKTTRLVEARVRLFEATGPAARAARVCAPRNAILAAQLHESRSYLRRQLRTLFAPALGGDRAGLLPALDALCSFETHELMRGDQGLSRTKTVTAIESAMTALLRPSGEST